METNIINFNEKILQNYQKDYPNLADFTYDANNDALVYNGNFAKLNGYGLSRIDQVFFLMQPDDIFTFFKNGFYQGTLESSQIDTMLNKMLLTEDEINFLESYAKKFNARSEIYMHNKDFFDKYSTTNENVMHFARELLNGRNVIKNAEREAKRDNESAAAIIYNSYMQDANKEGMSNSEEKGLSLTRNKPGFSQFNEDEYLQEIADKQKLGVSGFTSLVLLIAAVVTFGMYIAIQIMP